MDDWGVPLFLETPALISKMDHKKNNIISHKTLLSSRLSSAAVEANGLSLKFLAPEMQAANWKDLTHQPNSEVWEFGLSRGVHHTNLVTWENQP